MSDYFFFSLLTNDFYLIYIYIYIYIYITTDRTVYIYIYIYIYTQTMPEVLCSFFHPSKNTKTLMLNFSWMSQTQYLLMKIEGKLTEKMRLHMILVCVP